MNGEVDGGIEQMEDTRGKDRGNLEVSNDIDSEDVFTTGFKKPKKKVLKSDVLYLDDIAREMEMEEFSEFDEDDRIIREMEMKLNLAPGESTSFGQLDCIFFSFLFISL